MKANAYHGNLKAGVVKTGYSIIEKQGIENLSLREVARELGVSHGAPYRHFENKEALIADISQFAFEEFGECLKKAFEQEADTPYKRLSNIAHEYLDYALDNPEIYRLLTNNYVDDVLKYPLLFEKALNIYHFMLQILVDYDKHKYIQIENIFTTAMFMLSSIHGFCSMVVENRFQFLQLSPTDYHNQFEEIMKLAWCALNANNNTQEKGTKT